MNQITNLDKYAARLLMVSFCLPMRVQVIVVMLLCAYFVVRAVISKQLPHASCYLKAVLLGSPTLLLLLTIPFASHEFLNPLLAYCEQRISILLMPLLFAIIVRMFASLLINELVYFVYACIITCVAANIFFFYDHFAQGAHALSHVVYRSAIDEITGVHPTYMGMYLCFSICILLVGGSNLSRSAIVVKNVLLCASFGFLLALSPKAPLAALLLILVHYAVTNRATLYRYKALFAGLVATLAAAWFFIPFFSQRIKETVSGLFSGSSDIDNSISMRKLIWNMDVSLAKQYWLSGAGPGRLTHVLQEKYQVYAQTHPLHVPYYDTHSEYFFQLVSLGIAGLLILLVVIVAHFRKALTSYDNLYLYLLVILSATFFTETVLSMQRGVLFYAIFTSLFYFWQRSLPPAPGDKHIE